MFPKSAIATITGIGGMAGGVGSFLINKGSGALFDFAQKTWSKVDGVALLDKFPGINTQEGLAQVLKEQSAALNLTGEQTLTSLEEMLKALSSSGVQVVDGISTGYMIIFSICAVAYLIGWVVMKALVPKYKPIEVK